MNRYIAALAAFSLALAIGLGAIGAHAIGDDPGGREMWRTASFWHTADSLGLLAIAALWDRIGPRLGLAGVIAIIIGAAAFCGTVYVQAVHGAPPVPMLAPAGGTLQILGWMLIGVACLRGRPTP